MPSPRRRRLKRMLRAGLLKTASAVEAVADAVAPAKEEPEVIVEPPVVEKKKEKETKKKAKA